MCGNSQLKITEEIKSEERGKINNRWKSAAYDLGKMECPHLRESVKVNRDFIKNKKCELSMNSGSGGTTDSSLNGSGSAGGGVQWRCLGK